MRFIDHNGVKILLSDLSGIRSTTELQRAVRLGTELVQTQPPRSVLILVDLRGIEYSIEAFAIVQQSVVVNRPFVRARAIVGLPAMATVPFQIVSKLSDSPMAKFDTVDAAKNWLTQQV